MCSLDKLYTYVLYCILCNMNYEVKCLGSGFIFSGSGSGFNFPDPDPDPGFDSSPEPDQDPG